MKIGIIGVGHIGKTLSRKLSAAGHEVKVANSRGPETIDADALSSGARAVTAAQAAVDVDVVILSTPLNSIPQLAPVIAEAPSDAVIIDTSNYYPARDAKIEAIEAGQIESLWVAEQLARPVVKAWNAIVRREGRTCRNPRPHHHPRRSRRAPPPRNRNKARRRHRIRRFRRGNTRRILASAARNPRLLHRPHPRRDAQRTGNRRRRTSTQATRPRRRRNHGAHRRRWSEPGLRIPRPHQPRPEHVNHRSSTPPHNEKANTLPTVGARGHRSSTSTRS